ncbi:MAG TPA: NAD(P)H-dependent glycerol-3-phosphate dehydrogenase [Candidatus Babeliales bacterium]|nr:NAD(P)H-dependent glycerol-3-phosphate dehydrogenase [Candidatus Babeliales bacterium]
MKITVLGEGSWGTAISTVLAANGHDVNLWCHDIALVDEINTKHTNTRYMPDITLSAKIKASNDLESVLKNANWLFEAIPVVYLRSVLVQVKPYYVGTQNWVVLSKGIENDTLLYPSQMLQDVFGDVVNYGVLGGPSLARELIDKKITGVVVASENESLSKQLQQLMKNDYCLPYLSKDPLGVQIGGALKNVVTLGVGMLRSTSCCGNTQAWFLTRGFAEIVSIAEHFGAQASTLYGLSGLGDLILCVTGTGSRNFEVGAALGKGESLDSILERTGYTPEGINTLKSLYTIIQDNNLNAPICAGLYKVVFEGMSFEALLKELIVV